MKRSRRALLLGGVVLFLAGALSGRFLTNLQQTQARAQRLAQFTVPAATLDLMPEEVPGIGFRGLPRYPGSIRVEYRRVVYGDVVLTEAEYVAQTEAQALREFYRQVFDEHGWSVVDTRFAAGEWIFVVVEGEREAVVEIELRGQVANYEIKLTEPHRGTAPEPAAPG